MSSSTQANDSIPHIMTTTHNSKTPSASSEAPKAAAAGLWNSLKPQSAMFTDVLTPSANTPGATTPGHFSFDEPFGDVLPKKQGIDAAAVSKKLETHDGGLEGGFHGCEDLGSN
ncbi:hypothetical protein FKW77_001638 [Venturia effusa]|uniref:Uncharacterized protein n=1 Tax=Venturia effusa TaxID=50376 RepID=A0A517LD99_9PEZI|nr:hypothetical protein FKW77_001638 [Venturia effusa]